MLVSLLNMLLFACGGFVLMYFMYRPQVNEYEQTLEFKLPMLPLPYVLGLYALGTIAMYFAVGVNDFIEPLTLARVLVPLLGALFIYIAFWVFGGLVFYVTVISAVALTVYLQPLGVGAPFPQIPHYLLQISAVILGAVFCLGSRVINILPHTVVIPFLTVLCGICTLCLASSSPLFVGFGAALLAGILSAYLTLNYYTVKIDLDDGACVALAYLVCNLLLMNFGEFSFPSCIIFTMFLWVELIAAFWRRMFVSHSGLWRENTNYYVAAEIFTLQGLSANILRICLVLLFIGWFQLFSVNQYSLLIVAFGLTLWLNNTHGQRNAQSLKEINKEFVAELKQNIKETKDLLTRKTKDDE